MVREDLREQSRPVWEYFCEYLNLDSSKCNPDFMVCDEASARAGKVFDFPVEIPFPIELQCEEALAYALKEQAKEIIRDKYSNMLKIVVAPYSKEERETWFKQVLEAKNLQDATPMLSAMAEARGITVEDLASKILENETLYNTTVGTLLGQQQKELDDLEI